MKGETFVKKWLLTGTAVLALSSASAPASADQRPVSDFLSRQGTWCEVFVMVGDDFVLDCNASRYPGPSDICDDGFFNTFPQFWPDEKSGFTAGIDALGDLDNGDFGTTVDGSVTEGGSPKGPVNVNVKLHFSSALMRAFDADGNPVFGHLFGEVLNGADPTFGDGTVEVKFNNTARGAPLPDFSQLQACPLPGQALESVSIHARASGPLREAFGVPEGTPGRMDVNDNHVHIQVAH